MHVNDSFGHDPRITTIYNHHEQASAIAAEGYARISGKPAFVSVTSGPGATNALTGVAGAWLDSIPMVILSGQMKRETLVSSTNLPLRQLGFQEFNIVDAAKCMTKYCKILADADTIYSDLVEAYNLMMSDRKGPVWLDIPLDIQASQVSEFIAPNQSQLYPTTSLHKRFSHLNNNYFPRIFDHLKSATRPVIMVGYEIRMANCVPQFLKLADILGIPVVTEWNSHDIIPETNRFNSGRPGTIGDRAGNFVVQQSDFLICLGVNYQLGKLVMFGRILHLMHLKLVSPLT